MVMVVEDVAWLVKIGLIRSTLMTSEGGLVF